MLIHGHVDSTWVYVENAAFGTELVKPAAPSYCSEAWDWGFHSGARFKYQNAQNDRLSFMLVRGSQDRFAISFVDSPYVLSEPRSFPNGAKGIAFQLST
jgi:hypothetical protein